MTYAGCCRRPIRIRTSARRCGGWNRRAECVANDQSATYGVEAIHKKVGRRWARVGPVSGRDVRADHGDGVDGLEAWFNRCNIARRLCRLHEYLRHIYEFVCGSDPARWPPQHPGVVLDAVRSKVRAACLRCHWFDPNGHSMQEPAALERALGLARGHGEVRLREFFRHRTARFGEAQRSWRRSMATSSDSHAGSGPSGPGESPICIRPSSNMSTAAEIDPFSTGEFTGSVFTRRGHSRK